jgi:hypothetical protein
MVKETPKILYKALRQYAHNTRVGDLFAGFDYDETVKIVESLEKILADTIVDSNDQRHNFVMSEIKVKSQAKEIEGLKELVKLAVQWFGDEIENGNGNIEYDELELIYKKLLSKPTEPDTTDKGGG